MGKSSDAIPARASLVTVRMVISSCPENSGPECIIRQDQQSCEDTHNILYCGHSYCTCGAGRIISP